ncbi:ABC transporter ATP-binding protein [Rhodobacteraceae bacterium SC52]|nr:ABC transporter ATP-binding protein [Rhodobacteraceae bacterium SC52]
MTIDRAAKKLGLTWLGTRIDPFAAASGPPPSALWPFMRWCLRGSEPVLVLAGLVAVMTGSLEVVIALLLGQVVDIALASGPEAVFSDNTGVLLAMLALVVVARPLSFGLSAAMQSIVVGPNVNTLTLSRLHRWTLGQAVTFFDNDFAGRIAQKEMQTSRAVMDITVEGLNTIVFALASITASVVMLTTIDWRIALLLLTWLAGYLLFIAAWLPKVRARAAKRAGARAAVSGQVVDTVSNMRTVKLFANDRLEDDKALEGMGHYRDRAMEFGYVSTFFRLLLMTIAGLVPAVLVGSTLWFWQAGIATTGDIAATGAIAIRIAQMTGWVSFTLMSIYASLGEVEDGMRTLAPAHTLQDAPGARSLPAGAADVTFERASFAYGQTVGGVRGIDLTIRKGEKLGLVGASGAGKSTLVSLLLRLHDVQDGRVLVGGNDVRDVTQASLRRQVAMVTQETAMFNRSARDNILYGRTDATEAELHDAARKAEASEFIAQLKDHAGRTGYDAHLGERGVKLSGGQRQRIALARAILKDAPILVLDEATSALDSEVEASIQSALERVMEGKTVLAIAHRLSTLARMDRIIVMEQGQIVEEGTHEALLSRGGVYARYWHRQSGGFIAAAE